MASMNEDEKVNEEEKKIPVFTVLKNGSILKNIFVIDKPPPSPAAGGYEEILTVGRHPDCSIVLTHPSISRFHLQINSKPSSQSLSVMDLSSVHGTWVSEKKIEPGATVALKEGDTLRVGGSSRVYRLHWVPVSRAYDMEHPFVPELNSLKDENSLSVENNFTGEKQVLVVKENEETCQDEFSSIARNNQKDLLIVEHKEGKCQDCCSSSVENKQQDELESLIEEKKESDKFQGTHSSFSNARVVIRKEIPSAPKMAVDISSFSDEEEWKGQTGNGLETENLWCGPVLTDLIDFLRPVGGVIWEAGYQQSSQENQNTQSAFDEVESDLPEEAKSLCTSQTIIEHDKGIACLSSASLEIQSANTLLSAGDLSENQTPDSILVSQPSFPRGTYAVSDEGHIQAAEVLEEIENKTVSENINESITSFLSVKDLSETQYNENNLTSESTSVKGDNESAAADGKTNSSVESLKACSDEEGHRTAAEILDEIQNKENEWSPCPVPLETELGEHVLQDITEDKENPKTTQSLFAAQGSCERENLQSPAVNSEKKSSIWSRRGKPLSVLQVQTERSRRKIKRDDNDAEDGLQSEDTKNGSVTKALFSSLVGEEEEIFTPDKENFTPNTLLLKSMKNKAMLKEIKHPKSEIKAVLSSFDGEEEEIFTPDKENMTPNTLLMKSMKKKAMLKEIKHPKSEIKAVLSSFDGEEEEIFTPDKENMTPNTLLMRSMTKKAMHEEIKHSESNKPLLSSHPDKMLSSHPDKNMLTASNRKNQTQRILQERKPARASSITQSRLDREILVGKKNADRVPFQSMRVNSAGKSKSEASIMKSPLRNSNTVSCTSAFQVTNTSSNNPLGEAMRTWNMVVDTGTLLNKESMKSLKLLQGLKGTHLIIPRMVLRELHCLKRYGCLFRSNTEAASALEWIEGCISETKCWIHVQDSLDEGRLIAQTPTGSPSSSGLLSSSASQREVLSPTPEDNIVELAILFQKKKKDGQLVLLSNDVTTKIKAMAEGLICETVEEFRESLVNPFSQRFLWADSSPRGHTWSYLDDVVLWDKYHHCTSKKSWKGEGGAKGLKLILLHNTHYGQIVRI